MIKRCLYCYNELAEAGDFHEKCSLMFFGTKVPPKLDYSLGQMAELAKNVVERSITVPGVQPKLSMTAVSDALENDGSGRLTIVGALGGDYILKPPNQHFPEMPENEHVTMRIAEDAYDIKTVPSSLVRLASGELAYITKRIDSTPDGKKIHMLDMFQILEAFNKYKGSMERIGKAIAAYSENTLLDQLAFFELTLFCFISGNNDMHLKNFSMILNDRQWGLAPAYDLLNVSLVIPEDPEELALPIAARKRKLGRKHFEDFGKGLGLSERQVSNAIRRHIQNTGAAFRWLDKSFLSDDTIRQYKELIGQRTGLLQHGL
ncbi:serine/threonine-protein kinase HipA [Mucilaginibacter sp. SG538B]|uniref:HipA domain-containing protein n=1 Tax=Mucilaginibacter sp. SG538B TaxID=2587021 RepID=UPI00159D2DD0|nr:HipA domain-containing protein [Mucilaginibacter sp. SG538B]NVM66907.1 serine/threonine-protein kinase HipA [Mucilaginibacter sp. SG538B]